MVPCVFYCAVSTLRFVHWTVRVVHSLRGGTDNEVKAILSCSCPCLLRFPSLQGQGAQSAVGMGVRASKLLRACQQHGRWLRGVRSDEAGRLPLVVSACFVRFQQSDPLVLARCGSLLWPFSSAEVRSTDDVIAFAGQENPGTLQTTDCSTLQSVRG